MQLAKTVRIRRAHLLVPLMLTILGCAASVQAASKNELENNNFNCAQVGAPLKPVTRCEKCETDPKKGTVRCDVYYCDQSGDNCHPQAPHATADPQEPNLDYPLVGLADVNADEVADIAVGDPAHGQVIVLSGADNRVLATLKSENPQPPLPFGQWFTGVEDLNGDGVADLVTKESHDGKFSFFSGIDGAKLSAVEGVNRDDEAQILAPALELGRVAGDAVVGDLNKDGVADLAIVDPDRGQVLVFSGADGSLVKILAIPGLLDPVSPKGRRATNKSLVIGATCVERTKFVQSGSWRTLETLWNVAAQGHFRQPAGAQIKVRRGVGWFGWDTQKQTLNGETIKILSVGKSVIPSRMQMKVSQSTNVTYTYCPVGP
jgi:hypothetical protein